MSLRHILLGLLAEPASGYDLKGEFESSAQHFWGAELSQIYPTLRQLERDGLLVSSERPSERGPNRRVYRRTAAGTLALVDWLSAGPALAQERRHYLAQVFFLDAFRRPEHALEFMQTLRAALVERRATLETAASRWRECDPRYPDDLPDDLFYRQLTLEFGLQSYAAQIRWCDACIERMGQRGRRAGRGDQRSA